MREQQEQTKNGKTNNKKSIKKKNIYVIIMVQEVSILI